MMQDARRAHIHWPIFNRPGGAKPSPLRFAEPGPGEDHHGWAKLGEDHRVPPKAGHRFPNADVFLGQDTRMAVDWTFGPCSPPVMPKRRRSTIRSTCLADPPALDAPTAGRRRTQPVTAPRAILKAAP